MINNLEVSGVRFELNDQVKDYVQQKIGGLDKYMPKHERQSVRGEVILSEEEGQSNNRYTCEVRIDMPRETVTAKESTINMYAAIDIVEEKVRSQLQKHKDKQENDRKQRRTRRMWKQFRERSPF